MKRKIIALVLALSLCFAMYTGGTMAYLQNSSAELVNTFTWDDSNGGTSTGKVRIQMAEPNWKTDASYQFGTRNANDTLTQNPKPTVDAKYQTAAFGDKTTGNFGSVIATSGIFPGAQMAKDPTVQLDTAVDTYVGIKVTAPTDGWAKWDAIFSYTINAPSGPNAGWVLHKTTATARYYIYTGKLTKDARQTPALFDFVAVKTSVDEDTLKNNMPAGKNPANLKIQAFGVQAVVPSDAAWTTPQYAISTAFAEFAV